MKKLRLNLLFLFFPALMVPGQLAAQSWNLAKEKDGIKIYTRTEDGKPLKSYKGTALIHAPAEKVFNLIEDVKHTDWWDPNLSQIQVLDYEKYKRTRYYLVYDSPWPVANRDLCVEVTVNIDPARSVFSACALPITGVIPEKRGLVRIKDYRQTWTISPSGPNWSNVVLEGYVDPDGNIPDWISNMVVTEAPYGAIEGVRKRLENR
jgi:ribosome-associated toxin RatA of RatAB toxin-antitoxin module